MTSPEGAAAGDALCAAEGPSRERSPKTDEEEVWEEGEEGAEAWWERQQKWEEANTATEGAAVLLEELHCLVAAKPIYAMGTCEGFAALGLANGHVVLCSLSPLRELFSFEAHAAAVSAVELISPSQLLTGDTDGQVALWRLDEAGDDERRLVRFDGHSGAVAALQGDGDKLVSAARDGTVRVWDVEAGKERFRLQGFTRYVGSLHLTPSRLIADGTNNAICCLDFAPLDGAEPD